MTVEERLMQDLKDAMRAGAVGERRKSTIRMARSASQYAQIAEVIAATGANRPADIGKVMLLLMQRLKGKAEGRLINQIVRQQLEP